MITIEFSSLEAMVGLTIGLGFILFQTIFIVWALKVSRVLRSGEAHASFNKIIARFSEEFSTAINNFSIDLGDLEGRIISLKTVADGIEERLAHDQIERIIEKRVKLIAEEKIIAAQKMQQSSDERLNQALLLVRGFATGPAELTKAVSSGIPNFIPADLKGMIHGYCGQRNIRVPERS